MMVFIDIDKILDISMISLRRLIEGGPAIFIVVRMNHNRDIEGIRLMSPFVKNVLRV